jgi:dipeptidyl aminopeptidase/acylaminoacyl peptidase
MSEAGALSSNLVARWVGKDAHRGVPSQPRSDLPPPPHWRLEAIAATERPHHLALSPDGASVAFALDRDTSDMWSIPIAGGIARRLTVDRAPHAYWEDTTAAWSPDGERLAYVDEGTVCVVPGGGGPGKRLVEAGDPHWVDDNRMIVIIDRDRRSRLAWLDPDDPWPQPFGPADGDVGQLSLSPDRSWAVFTFYPSTDRKRSDIWRVDLTGGPSRRLSGTPGYQERGAVVSPDGSTIAFVSEQPGWNQVHLIAADGSGRRQLTDGEGDFSQLAFHPDGGSLVASRHNSGVYDLVRVDATSGEVTVIGVGGTWSDPSWTADGSLVALHEDQRTPPRIVRVDRDGSIATLLQPAPASVMAAPHVVPEVVSYKSFDGLEIPAFLFKPAAAEDKQVAAMVYPHGGPTSVYADEWDGHAQYFVDKGYAWLAINFRGSTGYGLEFERANHGVWGVKDTEDCLAAYDFLASLDWIDPRRIGIFGASYGSYMALCSLAMDPEHRFACGVLKYGDCNILTSWAQGDRGGAEDLERMMGHPGDNRDAYRAGSPVHHLSQVERPLLIAHGEQDERVHLKQSEELVEHLDKLGKTYEYVTYPTEGHGLLRAAPQVDFYRRLERFLDWYLM